MTILNFINIMFIRYPILIPLTCYLWIALATRYWYLVAPILEVSSSSSVGSAVEISAVEASDVVVEKHTPVASVAVDPLEYQMSEAQLRALEVTLNKYGELISLAREHPTVSAHESIPLMTLRFIDQCIKPVLGIYGSEQVYNDLLSAGVTLNKIETSHWLATGVMVYETLNTTQKVIPIEVVTDMFYGSYEKLFKPEASAHFAPGNPIDNPPSLDPSSSSSPSPGPAPDTADVSSSSSDIDSPRAPSPDLEKDSSSSSGSSDSSRTFFGVSRFTIALIIVCGIVILELGYPVLF